MGNLHYIIALVMIIIWAISYFFFHAGGSIHMLLLIAVFAIILRLIQGSKVF